MSRSWKLIAVNDTIPTKVPALLVNPVIVALPSRLVAAPVLRLLGWAFCAFLCRSLAAQTGASVAADIPRLATGNLELQWIDKHLPETGDQEQRRLALVAALGYFPGDPATDFRIEVRLAIVDRNTGRPRAAHERLTRLLRENASRVDRDILAWAEIVDARVLRDLRRVPESVALFERVASDMHLSGARRAMAAADGGNLMLPRSPDGALALLTGVASIPGGDTAEVEAAIVHVLLVAGRDDEVQAELTASVADKATDTIEARLAAILDAVSSWSLPGDDKRASRVAEIIGGLRPAPGGALSEALVRSRLAASSRRIRVRFTEAVAKEPIATWYAAGPEDRAANSGAIERLIELAIRQGDARRCLSLSLLAVSAPGPDGELPRKLWKSASYADWAERSSAGKFDTRVCDALLDLCDELPAGQDYWIEGKFLRAERLSRSGDRRGEQSVLNDVFSVGGLRPAYLAPACKRLGLSLEATGQDQKALEILKLAESTAGAMPAGVDCLLHEVLIDLRLGNNEDAIRLITLLQDTPARVLKGSSSPEQIRRLAALVRTGRAPECWDAGRKWWLEWQRLEGVLDLKGDRADERIPVVPDLERLLEETRRFAENGDSKAYFSRYAVLVSASRWDPSVGPEVADVSAPAFRFAPASRDQLRGLLIGILEGPHPAGIPNLRKRKIFLADNYLNARAPDKALHVAAGFDAAGPATDNLDPVMHQIRALAALDSGLEYLPASADLESDLTDPRIADQRAMAVGLLAELYVRLAREQDARQLLKRELDNPSVMADGTGHAALEARLARLSKEEAAPASSGVLPAPSGGLAAREAARPAAASAAQDWIRSLSLGWYGYVEPRDLEDPRIKNLDEALKEPEAAFPPAGQIKLLLLASVDPLLPPEKRKAALANAAMRLVLGSTSYSGMESIAASALSSPAFDDEGRLRILWTVLATLAEDGRKAEYDAWRRNPLCDHFSSSLYRQLEALDLEAGLDRTSPGAILRLGTLLGAREQNLAALETMQDLFGFLLRMGAVQDAEAFASNATSWRLDADAAKGIASVQLDFSRQLRLARAMNPIHEALAAGLLRSFPNVPGALPPEFQDARIRGELPQRRPGATFQACEYLASRRMYDRNDLGFWGSVFGSIPRGPRAPAVAADLLRSGLAAAPDDQARADLIVRFISSADIDEPDLRKAAEQEFAAHRKSAENPRTYLVIRLYEVHRALRLGEPVSLETAYADLNDPRVNVVRERDCLRHYAQVGDRDSLRRTIDGIDTGTLLSPGFVAQALPAFTLLGREAEAASAREAARRAMADEVASSWVFGTAASADAALDLALALGDPEALRPEWVRDIGAVTSDPLLQQRAMLVSAYLRSDWGEVERAAREINEGFPTRYAYYWYRGLALHHLGRDGEAAGALGIFVQRAKDDSSFPAAIELMKTIAAGKPGDGVQAR